MTTLAHVNFLWGRAERLAAQLAVGLGLPVPTEPRASATRAAVVAGDVRLAVTSRLAAGQRVPVLDLERLDELDRLLIRCRAAQRALTSEHAHA